MSAAICAAALWLTSTGFAVGQELPMPGMEPNGFDHGVAPTTDFGGVNFFSQDLGTVLRLRYNTESYGQNDHGNFDIGTMQVLTFDDWIAFCDAQVTVNDVQGVGFNVGTGFRWMTYPAYSLDGRIDGVSIWADGSTSSEDNFFPQLGISYESLGEAWDFRMNGYTPLGPQDKLGDFVPTDEIGFQGNSISRITEAVVNSSFYSAELEVARRMGPERDAWAFAGPYYLANDDDDAAGYRVGVRGYAYPDLLLQFAVSDDDIFHTNATFSIVWFVGRTRTDYQPACGVPDRFREPVMRRDYVVLAQSTAIGGIPLTQPDDTALRIVHVDSNAGPGGDGTFENPFDMLSDINGAGSQAGDVILAHAQSVFTGDTSAVLKDDQRLLGEGDGLEHLVATAEEGLIPIPETALGARNAARPMIVQAIGNAIRLADFNEVANFDVLGNNVTTRAIFGTGLTGNSNLHDLDVRNTTGFAIALHDVAMGSVNTLDEFTYDGGTGTAGGIQLLNFDGTFTATDSTLTNGLSPGLHVAGDTDGTVTFLSSVTFNSIDGTTVQIDGDLAAADQLNGRVIVNSNITNDTGRSVLVQGLGAGADVDFGGSITDTGLGILVNSNAGGTTTFNQLLDLDIDTADATAIAVTNNATAATTEFLGPININNTSSANGFVATMGGTLEVSNTGNSITTATGRVVQIENTTIAGDGVNFADITRTAAAGTSAVEVRSNTGGPITLGVPGDTAGQSGSIAGGTADAIVIDNSANVTVSGVTINNTSAVSGVRVNKTTTGTQTVNLNNLQINNGDIGVEITANGAAAGNLDMSINDTDINGSTDAGLSINDVDNGNIDVFNATIDGNNAGNNGVRITDSNASITFDADTTIQEFDGTDFLVNGGSGTISYAGDIRNSNAAPTPGDTTGRSVEIRSRSGGSVTFTSTSNITDDNQGILVQNNSGGTVNFQGTNDLDTGASQALQVSGNTGGTYNFNNFDITTTTATAVNISGNSASATINFNGLDINSTEGGAGFVASGPGTLSVSGTGNTIMTTTGTGLDIQDMTIGSAGVTFQSVTTNGAATAIVLEDLTGGLVLIGEPTGAMGSGGTLTTTGTAVIVRNVQLAELNNLRIANAGADGLLIQHTSAATTTMEVTLDSLDIDMTTGDGIDILADNDGNEFRLRLLDGDLEENVAMAATGNATVFLLVEDTDITVAGAPDAFALQFSGGARNGEITFRDNNNFMAADGRALFFDSTGGDAKLIDLLVEDSDFFSMNNAIAAADIRSRDNTTLNATIEGNEFDAPAAANDFDIRTDSATGRIRLKLGGADAADMNTAAGGAGTFIVREITGDFDIFEVNDTVTLDNRNQGAVNTDPNDAAFDNLPAPPPRPDLP